MLLAYIVKYVLLLIVAPIILTLSVSDALIMNPACGKAIGKNMSSAVTVVPCEPVPHCADTVGS